MSTKRSVKNRFSNVPSVSNPRSTFNRSHAHKLTLHSGYLLPIFVDEVIPGDTHKLSHTIFARMQTVIKPIMDQLYMETFYFFVPNRLLWENWQKFCGEQEDPGDSIAFLVPKVTTPGGGHTVGTLADYFGLPILKDNVDPNALHFRAYNLIYNEWFRDQNLQDSRPKNIDDGPDLAADYAVQRRGKRHDYFTSALTSPQKGTAIGIPFTGTIPVVGDGNAMGLIDTIAGSEYGLVRKFTNEGLTGMTGASDVAIGTTPIGGTEITLDRAVGVTADATKSGLVGTLSAATVVTINALRESIKIQELLEKDARGGTRYTEILLSHFGVRSPDSRLQRPEYLGGDSTRINITPVQQTQATEAGNTPQGNLSGYGVGVQNSGGFSKSFSEHGVIIGLINVRADLTYSQGINRMWSRQTRYDYYWPSFAHLGEQAILNKEIFFNNDANDELVFGYQERYAEYRYKPSQLVNRFRPDVTTPLDVWHLAIEFGALPVLNASFIEDNPPISRVVEVTTEPEFFVDIFYDLLSVRPLPVYGIPGFGTRF